jgi:hypothetical protein
LPTTPNGIADLQLDSGPIEQFVFILMLSEGEFVITEVQMR